MAYPLRTHHVCGLLLSLSLLIGTGHFFTASAQFTQGNLVVFQVGTGTGSLANTGNPILLREFTTAGTTGITVTIPSTGGNALQASGTATSEGLLTRSADGKFLVLTGYRAASGNTTNLPGSTASTIPRGIYTVDAAGNINTNTALTDYASGNNPRSAASADGTAFWAVGGAGGTRYATSGATTSTQVNSDLTNLRQINLVNGQLYASTGSGTATRLGTIGTGSPTTTGQTFTNLPGITNTNLPSPYSFFFADLSTTVPGVDVLYVSDDNSTAGGILKFSLVSGTWTLNGTLGAAADAYRGLVGSVSGTSVTLFATRKGSELVGVTDATGYNVAPTGTLTLLATAATNTAFRGVAFAPTTGTPQPSLAVLPTSLNLGNTTVGTPGTAQSYGITASNLTAPLGITAPAGVEISTSAGGTYTGTLQLAQNTTTATIFARLTGAAVITVSGSITNASGSTSATVGVTGNVTAGAAPTIGPGTNSPYLNPPNISGVIGDPTDPASTIGVSFTVADTDTPTGNLVITASSNNASVVPDANLTLAGAGNSRTLTITPVGVGYATITVSVSDGVNSASYIINYAASAASTTTSRFHTGRSDASTAQDAGGGFMFVADDESNVLRLYNRTQSGLPVYTFDPTLSLNLTDLSGGVPREVDIEASAQVGSRIYWLGSHSNAASGNNRPNRSRLFATDLSGSGASATLSFVGYYTGLKTDLITWDQSNGHGFGANYFGLAASAATGVIPEAPDGSGFNIEAAVASPDNSALYVGFRAPISPANNRTRALIVPVTNFATLVSGSPASGPATFGAPILLDLGGRGIREMKKNANNEYLIIAGPVAGAGSDPNAFKLYTWTGNANDPAQLRAADLSDLSGTTGGSSVESVVSLPTPLADNSSIQLVMDNGDQIFYNDGQIAKDLPANEFKKARSDYATLGAVVIPPISATLLADVAAVCSGSPVNFSLTVGGLSADATYSYTLTNGTNQTTATGVSAPVVFLSVVPTVAGSFTATVLTSLNSSTTATSGTIALNSLPTNASLTSGTLTCNATSVSLTASATGGTSYTLLGGSASQSNTTGVFEVSAVGTYTALISNASGCSASATASVVSSTEVPTVSIIASTTTLSTATPTASLTAVGMGTVLWSTTESTSVITVSSAGTYSVVLTGANGCTASASISVTTAATQPSAGSVVISQVYGGGGGSGFYLYDYVELFNRGGTPVSIQGLALQYGSAAGNFGANASAIVSLTGTIQPGQYYLVQVGGVGTAGAALPRTPDFVSTNINMAQGSGKIALTTTATGLGCGATATPCSLPNANIVDLVSYGAANNGEGGTTVNNGSVLTNQQGSIRKSDGCQDTNNNNADFTVVSGPVPRNTASPTNLCVPVGPTLAATPNSVSVSYTVGSGPDSRTFTVAGSSLTPGTGNITVSSSNTAITVSADGTTFGSSAVVAYTGGALSTTTFTARLVADLEVGTYPTTLTVVGGGASTTVAVAGAVNNTIAVGSLTLISTIQGTGLTSPLVGQPVTIEGIVTRAFPGSTALNGFFVQEEDADADGNPLTSEGVFCFDPNGLFSGNIGDKIRVSGTVAEFVTTASGNTSTLTQLTGLSGFTNVSVGTLPAASVVALPVAAASGGVPFLERFEGMLITARASSGSLVITDHFNLGRFGQVLLSAADPATSPAGGDARIYQYTQFNLPSVAGNAAYQAAIALREIYLDDASGVQNPATILFGRGGNPLSATNTLRGGDGVPSITTVLDHRFEGYRLQSNVGVNFQPTNPRPATLPTIGGSLKVAGANVLNFFNGPSFPTSRGADNLQEYNRQLPKIVANLIGTQSDIIAISEIQNNGYGAGSAIQALVTAMNSSSLNTTADSYTFVNPNTSTGTDEITVALIYKSNTVMPVGAAAVIPNSFGNGAFDVVGRKPVAQTFRQTATGGVLTVVGNHWKSKGSSSGGAGDADAGDGQALSNGTRTRQAQDLAAWLATSPTGTTDPDYLILGDLNAYAQEDPIRSLTANGYNALLPASSYSFLFDGQWGSLDHALSTTSLTGQVTGATKWFINSDEPRSLDYNTEFKTPEQITSLFAPDQYRSADHDPLVVGFNLTGGSVSATLVASTSAVCTGDPVAFSITVGGLSTGQTYSYTLTNGTNQTSATGLSASAVQASVVPSVAGSFTLTVLTSANSSTTATSGTIALNSLPTNASLTSGTLTCNATSVTLTASATGGTSYTLLGGPASQSNTTGVFEVSAVGTYTAIISNASGCTASAIATVSSNTAVPATPALSGASLTVATSTTPLVLTTLVTATASHTLTFFGTNGVVNPPLANISTPGVQTFSAVQTNAAGCVSLPRAFTLTVISTTSTSQSACRGSRVVLNAPTTGVRYQWFRLNGSVGLRLTNVPGVQLGTTTASLTLVSVQTSGTYTCQVTDANGAVQTVGPFVVNVTICGARVAASEPVQPLQVRVAPNPVVGNRLRAVISGAEGQPLTVELSNMQGRTVASQRIEQAGAEQVVDWDVSGEPSGLLFLRVITERQSQTVKVLKE